MEMVRTRRRSELGAKNVGAPIRRLEAAVIKVGQSEPYRRVHLQALRYYLDKFLKSWFPGALDEALSTTQLSKLDPLSVKRTAFLLLATCVWKLHHQLVPDDFPNKETGLWMEDFLARVAEAAGLDPHTYAQLDRKIQNDDGMDQIIELGNELGIGNTLFAYHTMMIEIVAEDCFKS
jgi:hypothetical protein